MAERWNLERAEHRNVRILVTSSSVLNAESRGRILPVIGLVVVGVGFVLCYCLRERRQSAPRNSRATNCAFRGATI